MVTGVILGAWDGMTPIVQWGGAGATVPPDRICTAWPAASGRLCLPACWIGVLTGGLSATAAGHCRRSALLIPGCAVFKPGDKR